MDTLDYVIIGVFFALVLYVGCLSKQVAAGNYALALIRAALSIAEAEPFGIDRAETAGDRAGALEAGRRSGAVRTTVSSS